MIRWLLCWPLTLWCRLLHSKYEWREDIERRKIVCRACGFEYEIKHPIPENQK